MQISKTLVCQLAKTVIKPRNTQLFNKGSVFQRPVNYQFFSSKKEEVVKEEEKVLNDKDQQDLQNNELQIKIKELDLKAQNFEKQVTELKQKNKELENFNADQQKKLKEIRQHLLDTIEDSEQQQKRAIKEKEQMKVFAISKFAKDLLEVQDCLEMALQSGKEQQESNFFNGVKLTNNSLNNIFKSHGIVKTEPINQKFNPNEHEALFQVDDATKEVGTIAHVMQPGYMIQDRVLRAAKVGVVKQRENQQ